MSVNTPTARSYLDRGFAPLPIPRGQKKPARRDWPDYRADPENLRDFDNANVGLLLGAPSGGLVDVDLDCPEAARVAPTLLPPTGMVSGRAGAPKSHFWYQCGDAPAKASTPFDDPAGGRMVELRSTGGQTVVAPSIHPDGDRYTWHDFDTPTRIGAAELLEAVKRVAAAALLARHWPHKGARQDAFLALAGGLARCGLTVERAEAFVLAVALATGDDEVRERANCVRRTFEAVAGDKPATGWPKLGALIGERGKSVTGAAMGWLGHAPRSGPQAAFSAPGAARPGSPRGPRFRPETPYVPFPTAAMPSPWGDYCAVAAGLLKCDAALVALPQLSVLASAIGMTRRIALCPTWTEPAVIWTCVVAESGGKKSPAADFATRPVEDRQSGLFAEYATELAAWDGQYGGRKQKGESELPPRPTAGRVMVSDATIEKLATLLQENPRGLLQHRDEMAGWIGSFTRYKGGGGGSDEANWLTMHRGGQLSYDRKTGTHLTVWVPNACVSVAGGIQPYKLAELLHRGLRESGLAARLLFALPPKTRKEYVEADIPRDLKDAATRSLDALYALTPEPVGGGRTRPFLVTLTPAARDRWKAFVYEWGHKTFEAEGDRAAAFAKLESYAARFALVHHLAEHAPGGEDRHPIGVRSVEAGIELAHWFAGESERVYALFEVPEVEAELHRLAESVGRLAARHEGGVTAQKLQQSNGRKYRTADDAWAALQTLVDAGAGTWTLRPNAPNGQARNPAYRPSHTSYESYQLAPANGPADGGIPGVSYDLPEPPDDGPGGPPRQPDVNAYECRVCDEQPDAPLPNPYDKYDVGHDRVAESDPVADPDSGADSASTRRTSPGLTLVADGAGLTTALSAVRASGRVGLDIETTGLDPRADQLCVLSLATAAGVFVIDCRACDPSSLWPALEAAEVVGHNLAFDLQFLARLGFTPGRVFDTMLTSQVLEAGDRAAKHNLKAVALRHLNAEVDKSEQLADWRSPLTPEMLHYAALDATLPLTLRGAMLPKLEAADLGAALDLENAALPAVAWASSAGVGFDSDAWKGLADGATAEAARLRSELDATLPGGENLFGTDGRNWDSPDQVRAAFASIGVPLESTDDDALAGVTHPLAALLRDYRGAGKLASTYGTKWLTHAAPDGRVYCRWNQCGTESGRMSAAGPNLQQLPRDARYRRCFVAPPGRALVKADYSQIELRLAAKIAGDKAMQDAYARGDDLHTLTARAVLGKADVSKADRQIAKAVNFGLLFGAGAKTLAAYARSSYGVAMTAHEAAEYRTAFFRTYPGLKRWHDRAGGCSGAAAETRTVSGRRRSGVTRFTERLNTPVQGSAADGLKAALALVWARRGECPSAVPVLFVHDEIVVEVDETEAERAMAWLKAAMVGGMTPYCDPVPVEVEASVARTWGGE